MARFRIMISGKVRVLNILLLEAEKVIDLHFRIVSRYMYINMKEKQVQNFEFTKRN